MTLAYAHAALDDLIVRAGWLDDSLAPGTPRPYRPPHLTAEAREAADALARAERRERIAIAPGDSPDPIWSDGVELRTDLLALADAMAERVAQTAGVERMPDASWDADPVPYLRHARRWLSQAAEVDAGLPASVTRKCQQYVARCDQALGLLTDGQVLPTLCFVCGGRDATHPVGGAQTMRYRKQHGKHDESDACGDDCRDYAVCEGGACQPSSEQVGYWVRGMPAWDLYSELDWLCDRLEITRTCGECATRVFAESDGYCSEECRIVGQWKAWAAENECPCGRVLWPSLARGQRAKYCSEDCRNTERASRMRATRAAEAA